MANLTSTDMASQNQKSKMYSVVRGKTAQGAKALEWPSGALEAAAVSG